jgi:hypothetical protein
MPLLTVLDAGEGIGATASADRADGASAAERAECRGERAGAAERAECRGERAGAPASQQRSLPRI